MDGWLIKWEKWRSSEMTGDSAIQQFSVETANSRVIRLTSDDQLLPVQQRWSVGVEAPKDSSDDSQKTIFLDPIICGLPKIVLRTSVRQFHGRPKDDPQNCLIHSDNFRTGRHRKPPQITQEDVGLP